MRTSESFLLFLFIWTTGWRESMAEVCSPSRYGRGCFRSCGNCQPNPLDPSRICDAVTGACALGCETGYTGITCEDEMAECERDKYGRYCEQQCAYCNPYTDDNSRACDVHTGECPHGCLRGYKGRLCDEACAFWQWGDMCANNCSTHCAGRGECASLSGTCNDGCRPGYLGNTCTQSCESGKYGPLCSEVCGKCKPSSHDSGHLCDVSTGLCLSGCTAGYFGEKCYEACPFLSWGENCANNCSEFCSGLGECDVATGTCTDGCWAGYRLADCSVPCSEGTYGANCTKRCGQCRVSGTSRAICDFRSGYCLQGCEEGFGGESCDDLEITKNSGHLKEAGIALYWVAIGLVAVILFIRRIRSKSSDDDDDDDDYTITEKQQPDPGNELKLSASGSGTTVDLPVHNKASELSAATSHSAGSVTTAVSAADSEGSWI